MEPEHRDNLKDADFAVDASVPGGGGCAANRVHVVTEGDVVLEILCDYDITIHRHYRQRTLLDKAVQVDGAHHETVGGGRTLQAADVIITAPRIKLVGDVRITGDCFVDGAIRAQTGAPWTPE